jgi:hypothetical protein
MVLFLPMRLPQLWHASLVLLFWSLTMLPPQLQLAESRAEEVAAGAEGTLVGIAAEDDPGRRV